MIGHVELALLEHTTHVTVGYGYRCDYGRAEERPTL